MKRRWIVSSVILLCLVVLLGGYRTYTTKSVNPKVLADLRTNPNGERAQRVMIFSMPDGRDLPVNYLREGNEVFVGADGPWWRQFREGDVAVEMLIQGESFSGRARTIMDDPDYTRDVFTRLRPNVPKWLPDWLNAYLIVIDIEVEPGT